MDSTANTKKAGFVLLLPILFCFFVMGFVDLVGTAVANIKDSLGLSATMAGLLPNFIFIWFIVCSIPAGMLMRKIGRKNMVQVSNIITLIGLVLPIPILTGLVQPSLAIYIPVFILMGIGNTIIQIALNPLLSNVAEGDRLTSSITLGQFFKALSSLAGPQIALFAATKMGDWNFVYIIYAAVILVVSLWLQFTPIPRESLDLSEKVTFGSALSLLKDKFILMAFLCILLIVGIDVGLNFFIPQIFKDVYAAKNPTSMNTLYFAARAVTSFLCAMMLTKIPAKKILVWTMVASIAAYIAMMLLAGLSGGGTASKIAFICMFLPVGFATGNVFSIIFSFAIQHMPQKSDIISALLVMGIAGGGAITFLMGAMSDALGIVGGMSVLLVCLLFIFAVSIKIYKGEQ